MSIFYDFFSLFFPRVCLACGNTLLKHEEVICTFCALQLPRADFSDYENNPAAMLFAGRVNIQKASCLFLFHKGSRVQHLMHLFKYKGRREIGLYVGAMLVRETRTNGFLNDIDIIIPVPLHPKKLRKRGYNQSEVFAKGISEESGIPYNVKSLVRTYASETQTKKSRFRRWENVKEIFSIKQSEAIENKHVLLVDDVLTTGATLEACARMLLEVKGVKVSVASIAYAGR